ncbi:MAG TPA: ferrous iron transport protein A [Firmicutes bacterium]|nr:ferrous iron transport protein A [Bacillota bacterium]HHY97781.1 ferrous iron transport protein A [Bacillota bacterium]
MKATLCQMRPGEEAMVIEIRTNDEKHLRKLAAMGLLPGAMVTLIQRLPACVFRVGESEFACDDNIARMVAVERRGHRIA